MNENEAKYFTTAERALPDLTQAPVSLLMKSLAVKLRRRVAGRIHDAKARMVWTRDAVSDADGPAANVRNYLEHKTIRTILAGVAKNHTIRRACEIGCGYGRVIMVLKEFAAHVKGFEREPDLVRIASSLLPDIEFENVPALTAISAAEPYDFAMTCTVLQHLTDEEARNVCGRIREIVPRGYVLIIEKTDPFAITSNTTEGDRFISRSRTVETYQEYMKPYVLESVTERVLEPTYSNPKPGKCMLFRSDRLA